MDAILAALNAWHQSTQLPHWFAAAVLGAGVVLVQIVVQRDDLLADLRAALRHAGLADKEAAYAMGVSKGLASHKLHGERPLTFDAAAKLPAEVWQWFAVALAERYGVPATVTAGARLARRQARMSMTQHARKEAV